MLSKKEMKALFETALYKEYWGTLSPYQRTNQTDYWGTRHKYRAFMKWKRDREGVPTIRENYVTAKASGVKMITDYNDPRLAKMWRDVENLARAQDWCDELNDALIFLSGPRRS